MYDSTAYNDNIKYGVFLTKVCLRAGVDELDTDKKKMQRMPINRSSQTRVTGQYQNQPSSSTAPPLQQHEEEGNEEGSYEKGPQVQETTWC